MSDFASLEARAGSVIEVIGSMVGNYRDFVGSLKIIIKIPVCFKFTRISSRDILPQYLYNSKGKVNNFKQAK